MKPMAKQLADVQRNGVYQLVCGPEEAEHAAKEARLAVFRINLEGVRDKKHFLDHVAKALNFPEWFGSNWDALNDCLTDLDWLSTKTGYVIVFESISRFSALHGPEFADAIAVLFAAAQFWKAEGRPFWAFVAASKGWNSGLPKWPGD